LDSEWAAIQVTKKTPFALFCFSTPLFLHTIHTMSNNNKHLDAKETTVTDEEQGVVGHGDAVVAALSSVILKIPPLTVVYWCEKMTATTFGETFADFFTQTLGFGYTKTSMILISVFVVFLAFQIRVKTYWPLLFWAVMASSSVAGTCISDFIDRTLQWGYPLGMGVLLSILLCIIALWKLSGEHMSVEGAMTRKAEAFYWSTILVSNTLGTALGDFMSDSLELGFGASAGIVGGLLCILGFLAYFTETSRVVLFWIAFVLTRPFGATFGDLLTKSKKKGGLDLGTLNASMVILALFAVSFCYELYDLRRKRLIQEEAATKMKEANDANDDN
jgi:uncharacterized membrane-anchored protein